MPYIPVEFTSSNNKVIKAALELPLHTNPRTFAIMVHDFANNHHHSAVSISKELTKKGLAVLRLALSAHKLDHAIETSYISLLLASAQYLETTFHRPCLLVGHGLGGAIALYSKCYLPYIRGIITINSPSNLGYAANNFIDIGRLECPLLTIHGRKTTDTHVGEALRIYHAAQEPKHLFLIPKGDELLSKPEALEMTNNCIERWLDQHFLTQLPKIPFTQKLGHQIKELTDHS